jgi:hypothetical protein
MALMQKPTGPSPEDTTEPERVVSLQKSGDAEQQLIQVSPDFHNIRQDAAFQDWVALQPRYF